MTQIQPKAPVSSPSFSEEAPAKSAKIFQPIYDKALSYFPNREIFSNKWNLNWVKEGFSDVTQKVKTLFPKENVPSITAYDPAFKVTLNIVEDKEPLDYQKMADEKFCVVIDKTARLATIYLMDGKIDSFTALSIVNEAVDSKRSLYTVFQEKNPVGLTLAARCKYHLFYQLGFLSNVIKACMHSLRDEISAISVKKEDLPHLFDQIVSRASSFLANYPNVEESSRTKEMISRFSEIVVQKFVPAISFFKNWKKSFNSINCPLKR